MLSEFFESFTTTTVQVSWSHQERASAVQFTSDLRTCIDRAVLRRCTMKDSSESWYFDDNAGESVARSLTKRTGAQVSVLVEEGHVEHVRIEKPKLGLPDPSNNRATPSKAKKTSISSHVKSQRKLEVLSPPVTLRKRSLVDEPSFEAAFSQQPPCRVARCSGR